MTSKIILRTALFLAALLATPLFASPVIVFTEESSTVLTATLDGVAFGSVTLTRPDNWKWTAAPPKPGYFSADRGISPWLEPDSPTGQRLINFWTPFIDADRGTSGIYFSSESEIPIPAVPNGTILADALTLNYFSGGSDRFSIQFIDKGDTVSHAVPENGPTLTLLGVGIIALLGAEKRVRSSTAVP